jgi:putative endonuclease
LYTNRHWQNGGLTISNTVRSVILAQARTHHTSQNTFAPSQPSQSSKVEDCEMDTPSYVYILASQRYGTLYIGVTTDLVKRVWEHRNEFFSASFTGCYNVKTLVWYEAHPDIVAAIQREKQLKHWQRKWKIQLISKENPLWRDLYCDIAGF